MELHRENKFVMWKSRMVVFDGDSILLSLFIQSLGKFFFGSDLKKYTNSFYDDACKIIYCKHKSMIRTFWAFQMLNVKQNYAQNDF